MGNRVLSQRHKGKNMTTQQTAQEKLIEQFENAAKDTEFFLAQLRGLVTILKTETELTKESLSDWRGNASKALERVKIFAAWVEIDIIETDQFLAQQLKDQTNG